jgi:transcriptional regulator with XRE-family HTH domain
MTTTKQLQLTLLASRDHLWAVDRLAIERARVLAGLSYQELARTAKIDRATLSDFLNGRRQPTLGTVHRVLRCLEVDPKDVFVFPDHNSNKAA